MYIVSILTCFILDVDFSCLLEIINSLCQINTSIFDKFYLVWLRSWIWKRLLSNVDYPDILNMSNFQYALLLLKEIDNY